MIHKGIVLMILSSCLVSVGQLFWKFSEGVTLQWLIPGFLCYGLGALVMIIAYRYGELSVLQPLLSVSYVLALILSVLFLGETITTTKVLGIMIIMTGVILVGGGQRR